jgi:hypothetical protein
MPNPILLSSEADGTIFGMVGGVLEALSGQSVYVYQPGTTTQVTVYANSACTAVATQPLTTTATGTIPGYVDGTQEVDFYDATTATRITVELLAAAETTSAVSTEVSRAEAAEAGLMPKTGGTFSGAILVPTPPSGAVAGTAPNIGWVESYVEAYVAAQIASGAGSVPTPNANGLTGINWGSPIFDDEFTGSAYDTTKWSNSWFGTTNPVNGGEQVGYAPGNVSVAGGSAILALTTTPITVTNGTTKPYSGSILSSNNNGTSGQGFNGIVPGCFVEYRANIPPSGWPQLWCTPAPGDTYAEIDILEGLSGEAAAHLHDSSSNAPGISYATMASLTGQMHIYGMHWAPNGQSVTFYVDGVSVGTLSFTSTVAPTASYLVIINSTSLSSGQAAGTLVVDYARVWAPS